MHSGYNYNGDASTIAHVVGTWMPILASVVPAPNHVVQMLQGATLLVGMVAGLYSIIDSHMRIQWKKRQNKANKQQKKQPHEGTDHEAHQ